MNSNEEKRPTPSAGRYLRAASFWVLIFLIPLAIYELMGTTREPEKELTYTEFREQLAADNILNVTIIEGLQVEGELRTPLQEGGDATSHFNTLLPSEANEALLGALEEAGVEIEAKASGPNWVS